MSFKGRTVFLLIGVAVLLNNLFMFTIMDWPLLANGQATHTSSELTSGEIQKLNSALDIIENKYIMPVERHKIVDGAVHGMIASLGDPHSSYMGKEKAEQFNRNVEGAFIGIGVVITMENNQITVVSPIKGSPAEKAGLKPKDVLVSIDGVSLRGKKLDEAMAKIRGPKGTQAKIMVKRAGKPTTIESIVVVRDEVDIETVFSKMLDGNIGYIEVRQFSLNTFDRFKKELALLEEQGMKGLIIDVRSNPGGVLDVVQKMAELFVPEGKPIIHQVEDRNKKRSSYISKGTSDPNASPVVVLINKGSASASEVMASALKESAGAKLIGERTFGKGTVQGSYHSEDGGQVKITIAKWLTPQGNWIHQKGIEPHIAIQQPDFYHVKPIPKNETLAFNMNSLNVKNVQIILNGLGYKPGRKDGYFSKETETAVRSFQRDYKLAVSGKVDAKTGEQLERAILKVIHDPQNDAQLCKAVDVLKKETR